MVKFSYIVFLYVRYMELPRVVNVSVGLSTLEGDYTR